MVTMSDWLATSTAVPETVRCDLDAEPVTIASVVSVHSAEEDVTLATPTSVTLQLTPA